MRVHTGVRGGLTILSATWVLAACGGYFLSVTDKRPVEPLPIYAEWWVATEQCSGRAGPMSRVSWFSAEVINSGEALGRGLWRPPHDIVIARGYETDEKTVRHEILHDLLDGDPGHRSSEWRACDLLFK